MLARQLLGRSGGVDRKSGNSRSSRTMQLVLVCVLALLFAGCNPRSQGKRDPAIATAFAGPVSLPLRAEVNPKSKTVSTVNHGDKLEVLQVRRRFVRVRGP